MLTTEGLDALAAAAAGRRRPLHLWQPQACGAIDIAIDAEGRWFHEERPIARPALIALFASILRREGSRYVLVTPVEKVEIRVADVPFAAVELEVAAPGTAEQAIGLRTNVGEWVVADADHPLRFARDGHDGLKPYVLVRDRLWARLARPLLYELVDLAEEDDGGHWVRSRGMRFDLAAGEGAP